MHVIIFHDPRSLPSLAFYQSLPQGSYMLVDWSDPNQQAPYAGATIRAFPSVLITMSDGTYGLVDCILQNVTTYAQAAAIPNTIVQGVPTDTRIQSMPFMPNAKPVPQPTPTPINTVVVNPGVIT